MYFESPEIRAFAQQTAEAIQSVLGMDITIIDDTLTRVAGTGEFRRTVGCRVHSGFVSETVIRTAKACFIESPRSSPVCRQCSDKNSCTEAAGLLVPIALDSRAIGAVGMFVHSGKERDMLRANHTVYENFMEKMADLIVAKINSHIYMAESALLISKLNTIIDRVPYSIICIDGKGTVTDFSKAAEDVFGISASAVAGRMFLATFACSDITASLKNGKALSNQRTRIKLLPSGKAFDMILSTQILENPDSADSIICFLQEYDNTRRLMEEISHSSTKAAFARIKGNSPEIMRVIELAGRVAQSSSTVMLTGESGTGKELFARSIHDLSPRKSHPFVAVNCSSIPDNLLESELFGYEDGAFTGSRKSGKKGKFELANSGTLFLDEIGDMDFNLQAKLLRVLEQHSIDKLGGTEAVPVDIRIISATNKNLEDMVSKGLFREDLYYRLNVIPIHIPPLRYRKSDLKILINHFLDKYNRMLGKNIMGVDSHTYNILHSYDWPGNVRELANVIEYCAHMEIDNYIHYNSLPQKLLSYVNDRIYGSLPSRGPDSLKESARSEDSQRIYEAIALFGSTTEGKKKAAEYLGISLSTLYRRLGRKVRV